MRVAGSNANTGTQARVDAVRTCRNSTEAGGVQLLTHSAPLEHWSHDAPALAQARRQVAGSCVEKARAVLEGCRFSRSRIRRRANDRRHRCSKPMFVCTKSCPLRSCAGDIIRQRMDLQLRYMGATELQQRRILNTFTVTNRIEISHSNQSLEQASRELS